MKAVTLGILGGGQLGRMSALAAARLGISCVIYTPQDGSPASLVAAETIIAPYDDEDALRRFAAQVDVISYEFENIPVKSVRFLKTLKPVYPDENLLEVAQDRVQEKSYLNGIGIPTAPWVAVDTADDVRRALSSWGVQDGILKTTRMGYDGKGQARISAESDLEEVFGRFKGQALILEGLVDFSCEVSVIVARDQAGTLQTYGSVLNEHENHILSRSICPAGLEAKLEERALELARTLAAELGLVGVLALEMFVTKDGQILANEIAPRTHNSGHWTIDACAVSQFENHVRCVCGLPAGLPAQHSRAEMLNIIGEQINDIGRFYTEEGACVHIYGKTAVRAGRKMAHVTRLKPMV